MHFHCVVCLTYQDCMDMRKNPEFEDNYNTWEEQVCLYWWWYGIKKEKAVKYATLSIEDGGLDKNGAINGEGIFSSIV